MRKSTVMSWTILGVLSMSCSEEEIVNVKTSSRNAIGFNVLSNTAETRATPTTNTNLKNTDFDVSVFTADGIVFMGKDDMEFEHDGVKIVYKNGKWDYDNASDLRYWSTEALDFYAFNPGTVSEDMTVLYSQETTKDVQEMSYIYMDEHGAGTHANYDVMYVMAKGQTKDMNNGIVKFNFKHILSQVVFKAKIQYDNMRVDTDVIKIHNFKLAGASTLSAVADGTGSRGSSDLVFPHAFTVAKNANITANSNTEATDITTNTPMLNTPQELTAWIVSGASKARKGADGAEQCYLEIACKIRQSGTHLLDLANEYETVYVLFGDTREQGKRHIYTLIFDGGYTNQGEVVSNPIQLDAETTGWVNVVKDVNVQLISHPLAG